MACQLLKQLAAFNVPNDNGAVIASREHAARTLALVLEDFNRVDPSLVPLEHHVRASLQIERANDRITASDVYFILMQSDALNGLFGGDETLHDFVLFQVYAPYHLVPGGSEQHFVLRGQNGARDRICKLENGLAQARRVVPLPHCAVVRRRDYVIGLRGQNCIDSVSVANQREAQLTLLVPCDDETIFIASVNFIQFKAKTANELLILLPLLCTRSIKNMFRSIIYDLILMVFELKQFVIHRSCHFNLFG